MKAYKLTLPLIVVLLLVLFASMSWGANQRIFSQRQPNFTMFSTGELGMSLLYDTLRHMHYPVDVLYQPISTAGLNDAVFIIQPTNPRVGTAAAEEILNWVRQGGRLIYLENRQPTIIDRVLTNEIYTPFGDLRWYRLGMGEVVTGQANSVVNINLMNNSIYGRSIAYVLYGWNPDRIYFAEYYHGFHRADSAFNQLPTWLRLTAFQIMIAAAVLIWHLGKRFGSPIPLYEEIEREENEQVMVLARLYKQADRRSK